MRYGIRLSTATLIATASLAFVPTTVGATDRVAPPQADQRSGVPHIAPPEADLLAEQAALDDRVTSPLPALAAPQADQPSGVPHIAPPEADLLAEQAALDDRVTSPGPALAQTGDGFDYTDGAIGAAITAGTGLILIAGIRRRRKFVLRVP